MTPDMMTDNLARAQDIIADLRAKLVETEMKRDAARAEAKQWYQQAMAMGLERNAARAALVTALAHLDSSLFTNAEHQRAKETIRAAIAQEKADE
ncbi:MAG: hypothetical protein II336_17910 [Loktanella sp.]|nr:hypothetical protein [Loktanella sp.]